MRLSKVFKRWKDPLTRKSSDADSHQASNGQSTQTTVPPDDTSSSGAAISRSPPSLVHQEISRSHSDLPQATESLPSVTCGRTPIPSAYPTAPRSRISLQSETAPSLWNRAYEALRDNNTLLVNQYEKLLSKELLEHTVSQDMPDQKENLNQTENRINNDPNIRQNQLKRITDRALLQADERQTKYIIFGHNFVLRNQVAQTAQFIQAIKDLVNEAVKASPEASLAWAGVCVLLPVFTNPVAAEEANREGLSYVTSRIRYYIELERLLWPVNLCDLYLKAEFENHIIELYQYILEFQIKTVLRFYRKWLANVGRDIIHLDGWEGILSKIKELEQIVWKESSTVNSVASRNTLEGIGEVAQQHYNNMRLLLSVAKEHLQVSSEHLAEHKRTNQILEDRPIDLLTVHEARYDSADVQYSPKCEEGTRIRIQETITQWANEDSAKPLFWLVGPAGTGKSTIARTIADSFASENRMVAGYFFKRGEQGRNDTARLFPTLAMQVVDVIPPFKRCLQKSLDGIDGNAVEKRSLENQFNKLLRVPLADLPPTDTSQLPRVIIIDALDECERPEHFSEVLTLLSKLHNVFTVRLRVLVTSRSTPKIIDAFDPLLRSNTVRSLELHREFSEDTKTDIRIFLKRRFADIKTKRRVQQDPWPAVEDLDRLIQLATNPEPLFIYAATLCRFVFDEQHPKNPKKQLKLWLKQCEDSKSQLNQIYDPILSQVFSSNEETEFNQQLLFLGALVLLATPLPAVSVAVLLGIDMDDVSWWLHELHAVLDIPAETQSPLRLLHKSFSDFLLSPNDSGACKFRVNAERTHSILAVKCIKRMKAGLKRDICDIRKPGTSRDKIDKRAIDTHIHADLEYACLNWFYHLQRSGRPIYNEVCTFLYEHFLHWVEALSLLGRLSDGAFAVKELLKTIKGFSDTPSDLSDFLKDASKVIASFGSIIEIAPLQTYGALLVFSPNTSEVRQRFWNQRLTGLDNVQGGKSAWDSHRQTLEGHSGSVSAVAFSPDGQVVASASRDSTVRLWDAVTGAHRQTLEGHSGLVSAVAFSPDSQVVASASRDSTVRLWDAVTGAHRQTLEGHSDWVSAVAFSPDGQVVASASDDSTVRLWDAVTGAHRETLEGHSGSVSAVAFSPDSQVVASASRDKTVRLWDAVTGVYQQTLNIGTVSLKLSFDPNCLYLYTDVGAVSLQGLLTAADTLIKNSDETACRQVFESDSQNYRSGYGISNDQRWITTNECNLLWIPADYRPVCSAVFRSTVVIGTSAGMVLIMRFSA